MLPLQISPKAEGMGWTLGHPSFLAENQESFLSQEWEEGRRVLAGVGPGGALLKALDSPQILRQKVIFLGWKMEDCSPQFQLLAFKCT